MKKFWLFLATLLILSTACGTFDGPPTPVFQVQETDLGIKSVRFDRLPEVDEVRTLVPEVSDGQVPYQLYSFVDGDTQLIIFPPQEGCGSVKVELKNWRSRPFMSGSYITDPKQTTQTIQICAKQVLP